MGKEKIAKTTMYVTVLCSSNRCLEQKPHDIVSKFSVRIISLNLQNPNRPLVSKPFEQRFLFTIERLVNSASLISHCVAKSFFFNNFNKR